MKYLPKFILSIFILFLVSDCGGGGQSAAAYNNEFQREISSGTPGMAYDDSGSPATAMKSASAASGSAAAASPADSSSPLLEVELAVQTRKLVKRADLRLRVDDPAATEKPLSDLMEKYGAWPATAGIDENSRRYSIRVPSVSYNAMLAELEGLGKVLRRTENAEDVTLRYYDLESRLATRKELLKTYQSYLGKAKNIDEIMTVESRIADLQQEIDQTGTQFRNLANLVDYSTINVDIAGPVSAVSYSEPTLGEKLKELFSSFGGVASTALVVIMGIIIYAIPALLILILLYWILFGRIGLLKRLLYLAAGKKPAGKSGTPDSAKAGKHKKENALSQNNPAGEKTE